MPRGGKRPGAGRKKATPSPSSALAIITEPIVTVVAPVTKSTGLQTSETSPRGKRGPKKGAKYAPTIAKEHAREVARQIITRHLEPMIRAQVANALGIGHVYTRDRAGKFTKIENVEAIDKLLSEGAEGEHYWIFAKDPSVQAFTDLMNRALDKPKEQPQELDVTLKVDMAERLRRARARAHARNHQS